MEQNLQLMANDISHILQLINFLMWAIGLMVVIFMALIGFIWNQMSKINEKIENLDKKFTDKIDSMDKKFTELHHGLEKRLICVD